MKPKLSASVMCADLSRLGEDVKLLEEEGVDSLHFDIMDGHFVPNLTLGPGIIQSLRKTTDLPFDTHLMIEEPGTYIPVFAKAGSDLISVHVEACPHLERTIQLIKENGLRAGVAISSGTPLCRLEPVLGEFSQVLIMTVNPGFVGQKFVPIAISKIEKLSKIIEKRNLEIDIAVGGNVSFANAPVMVKAGANILICGTSSIFHPQLGIKEGITRLRAALE